MDKYHQTDPPTELKSSVMGKEGSRKSPTVTPPPTNCSAFPVPEAHGQQFVDHPQGPTWEECYEHPQAGMTLRDYYAAKALQGLCANPGGPFQANGMSGWSMTNCSEGDIARLCHDLADAMLIHRKNA